jgi:hypothetical protein
MKGDTVNATATSTPPVALVYAAIAAVSKELSKEGIAKDRLNQAQNYKYRSIDDVLNAIGPVIGKHALVIMPNVISRDVTERATRDGKGTLLHVVIWVEFTFICFTDGSSHLIRVPGEGLDNSDKGTSKALSMAYKNATLMAFAIPVEGTTDADAGSPELGAVEKAPAHFQDWFDGMVAAADEGNVATLKHAWASSREEYRDYAEKHHLKTWEDAKRKAFRLEKARKAKEQQPS